MSSGDEHVRTEAAGRDDLFARTARRPGDFAFDGSVAEVFDDMAHRSIPFYAEQQAMVEELAVRLARRDGVVLDLGCATGTTLVRVCGRLPDARGIGVDASEPMLGRAREALEHAGLSGRVTLLPGDLDAGLGGLELPPVGFATICWTLQFLPPERREPLLRELHELLLPGAALVVAEKVVPADAALLGLYTDVYYEFKQRTGYSQTEIARKREALDGVLVPATVEENLALLRQAGFAAASTIFQWYPFAAFLAVKAPA